MYPNLYVRDLHFFLLDLLGCSSYYIIGFFAKGCRALLCVSVWLLLFFFFSIYLTSYNTSCTYCFFFFPVEQLFLLQLSVSPDCSFLRAERRRRRRGGGGGGERGSWVTAEWEGVGRGQEMDCEKKSKISYLLGLDDCCIFKVSFRYLLYFLKPALWDIFVKDGWFVFELKWMFWSTREH